MKDIVVVMLVFSGLMMGCATSRTVIRSEPSGATASIRGKALGKTPVDLDLDKALSTSPMARSLGFAQDRVVITFQLDGYNDDTLIVSKLKGSFGPVNKTWPLDVITTLTPLKGASSRRSGREEVEPQAIRPQPAKPVIRSDVDTPTYKSKGNPDNYALVIGIENYADLPDATFASRDSEAVVNHLIALGYPRRNIIHLSGKKATRAGIKKYLDEWIPRNVKPESTVFFYYSGHGAPDTATGEAYLVPWDGDAQFLKTTAYPLRQLYSTLNDLPVREVIVAIDSCFSGAGGRSVLAKGARPLVIKVDQGIFPKGKMVMFGAASGEEITSTLEEEGHGIFTYYFLKALNRKAKNSSRAITGADIYEDLRPSVQDAARRQNREQTPVFRSTDKDKVLFRFN